MSDSSKSINRSKLDESFAGEEQRKTAMLLEAQLLHERGDWDKSAALFAEAAAIEEELAERCGTDESLAIKRHIHQFSAASCRAKAGDFHHALLICKSILDEAGPSTKERLYQEVREFATTLQQQRSRWYSEVFVDSAA